MRISTSHIFNQNLSAMLNKQSDLGKTQLQVSTGEKIQTPSDDPLSAVEMLNLQREINLADQYISNGEKAESKLIIEEGTLTSATEIIHRIRELAVQGLNDTNTQSDRTAIAKEIYQLNEQLLSLANTQDSNGDYLFSGFMSDTQPYDTIGDDYNGDQGQRNLQVGPGVYIETNDPGNTVFEAEHIQTVVTDNAAPSSSSFRVVEVGMDAQFDSPVTISYASGTNTLTISDGVNTETVTPYSANTAIKLDTLNSNFPDFTVSLEGTLANGDSFTIGTQITQSKTVFSTINDFANALTQDRVGMGDSPNGGEFLTNISTALETIIDARARVGARINTSEQQREINDGLSMTMQASLSQIKDLDYAEAISRLTLQMTGLQAAQQSFTRVQGLSLFNYL